MFALFIFVWELSQRCIPLACLFGVVISISLWWLEWGHSCKDFWKAVLSCLIHSLLMCFHLTCTTTSIILWNRHDIPWFSGPFIDHVSSAFSKLERDCLCYLINHLQWLSHHRRTSLRIHSVNDFAAFLSKHTFKTVIVFILGAIEFNNNLKHGVDFRNKCLKRILEEKRYHLNLMAKIF